MGRYIPMLSKMFVLLSHAPSIDLLYILAPSTPHLSPSREKYLQPSFLLADLLQRSAGRLSPGELHRLAVGYHSGRE